MLLCPNCGRENPADAKFCNTCGTAVTLAPSVRKERKFATALFADLVGSTALAEREDPEVVQSVVGRTFDRLAQEIQRQQDEINELRSEIAPLRTQSTRTDDGPPPAEVLSQALAGPPVLAARTSVFSATSASTSEAVPGQSVSAMPQNSEHGSQESPLSFRIGGGFHSGRLHGLDLYLSHHQRW